MTKNLEKVKNKTIYKIENELDYISCINAWFEVGMNNVYMVEFTKENPKGSLWFFEPCTEDYFPESCDLDLIDCIKKGKLDINGIDYEFIGTDIIVNGNAIPL